MSLYEQIERNEADIAKCRAQLLHLQHAGDELRTTVKRKYPDVSDADVKRYCIYADTDDAIQRWIDADDHALIWDDVDDPDANSPDCCGGDCYYTTRMHLYDGYLKCKIPPYEHYCDVCVELADIGQVTPETLDKLRSEEIAEVLDKETALLEKLKVKSNPALRSEWRYITVNVGECDECSQDARYYLRGDYPQLCGKCFDNKKFN